MFNSQMPNLDDLPTSRQLVRSTFLAAAAAGALLVTVILPSEYGIDPTGLGRVVGLTEMGKIKMQLAAEAEAEADAVDGASAARTLPAQTTADADSTTGSATTPAAQQVATTPGAGATRRDEMRLSLAPGEAAEIKVTANEGQRIAFDWSVSGGHVNYDTHGDRKEAPAIGYHGYGKGRESTGERGELIAAFDGSHGWFWRNRSGASVTVILRTEGGYTEIKRVV